MKRPGVAPLALAAALHAAPAFAGWVPVREFDFGAMRSLDPAVWVTETGFLRNRESQYYTPRNIVFEGGAMVFEVRREPVPNAAHSPGSRDWRRSAAAARYTSGSIILREPIHYGRIEVVARSPSGKGVWPAIWLLNEGAGEYGEIDIFEAVGKHPDTVFGAVHYGRTAGTRTHKGAHRILPGFDNSWRTHALEWTPERIETTVDGQPVLRFDPRDAVGAGIDPLRKPMQLRINLALGGSWGGPIDDAALPARFEIRSLRVLRWVEGETPAPAAAADKPPSSTASAPAQGAERPIRWGR